MKSPFVTILKSKPLTMEQINNSPNMSLRDSKPIPFFHEGATYLYLATIAPQNAHRFFIALRIHHGKITSVDVISPTTGKVQPAKQMRQLNSSYLKNLVFFPLNYAAWAIKELARNPADKKEVRDILQLLRVVVMEHQALTFQTFANMFNSEPELRGALGQEFLTSCAKREKEPFEYLPELIIAIIKTEL